MNRIIAALAIVIVSSTALNASYEDALKLFDEKKYRESLKTIADSLVVSRDMEADSPNYRLRYLAAHNHWKLGTHDSALQHFQRCIQIKPDTVDPYIDIALMLIDINKHRNAEGYIKKGLEIKQDPMLYHVYGSLAMNYNNTLRAKDLYEKAISLNPELYISYNGLGLALMRLKRYSEANTAFTVALSLKSSSAEILNNLGYSLIFLDKNQEAVKYLEKAHLVDPENSVILANLNAARNKSKKSVK